MTSAVVFQVSLLKERKKSKLKRDKLEEGRPPFDPNNWNLYGWDDGRLYFSSKDGEICVNDYPDLMKKLIADVENYLEIEGSRREEKK
jgi:hypothetical protein